MVHPRPAADWDPRQSFSPILCRCRPLFIHPFQPRVEPVPTYMTTLWRLSPDSPSPCPAFESQCRPRADTPSMKSQRQLLSSFEIALCSAAGRLTTFEVSSSSLSLSVSLSRRWSVIKQRTGASMMISLAPRKKAVLRGSLPLGISSKKRVLSAQSKCYHINYTLLPHQMRAGLTLWI